MKPRDLTDLALRNLRESLLRNALTTLGVAVGVASLVAMLSLGVGLQQLAAKRLSQSGLFDTILVTPKNAFRGMGRPQREPESDKPPRILDDDVRKEMERLPNVIEVYPQVRFFTEVRFNNKPFATVVAGMPDSSRNSGSFDGMQGNFFSSTTAKEAILQIEFAKDLSDKPSSLIGQELVLRYAERQSLPSAAANTDPSANSPDTSGGGFSVVPKELRLKIVGIVETEPAAGYGGYGNARLLMPLATASTLRAAQVNDLRDIVPDSNAGKTTYASLSVRAKSPSQVEALETSIKKMGLNAFSLLDASKSLRTFFTVFDSLLGIFGCLALAVATLGIVNTLVMAILERRREIGVLKALGAADSDVQQLFFVEAGVMGFFGGVFGVLFGWLLGRAVTFGTNVYLQRQNLNPIELSSVPLWLVFSALAFAILVSLAAGLYPASRAAKLNPVDALRYE
ncbi:MAG TPA: FtsX-like permease family protein [Candidatus Acidoferrales bacterium]|jgi:putative ABC transport system permease protein|nr:FtsX-like permease family protein [Candidatus Acidoferrales bacterium]